MTESTAAPEAVALAAGFPEHDLADWRALAAGVVNRRRPESEQLTPEEAEASLRVSIDGGVTLDPLYMRPQPLLDPGMPGAMPFTRGRTLRDVTLAWDVRALHDDPDVALTRAAVLDDLEHGVTSVWLHLGDDGLAPDDLAEALADVRLDLAPVVVSSTTDQQGAANALLAALGDGSVGGNLGLDPVGAAGRLGTTADLSHLADAVRSCSDREGLLAIAVDTRALHDAGADDIDEIAFAVTTGLSYLRHLEAEGIPPAEAFQSIEFRVSATADQFLTAARLRALRRVWARVGEVSGVAVADRAARTHAVTSLRMASREDPWVNVLRGTLAAFGASLGGADAITVLPYDTVWGLPERLSRRLARNTQILLADEANVGRVTDPAGGSWYLESLTDDVARSVWATVQDLERAGGMLEALRSGSVHSRIQQAASARDKDLATRRRELTGVSTFPILDQPALVRRPRAALPTRDGGLPPHRDA
ncbi:MAG: methylmalonyl-CoA mutase subunit beta, partial [Ornithinibacter sp.]